MKGLLQRSLNKEIYLIIFAIIACLWSLFSFQFLIGFDAYYYALQSKEWFQTGKVLIPDPSIIHRIIGAMQYTGIAAETAFKYWLTISYALFCFTYWIGVKSIKSNIKVILVSFLLLSPSIILICIEFPKTFLLMSLFNLTIYILNKNKNHLWLIPICLGSIVLHKMGIVLSFLFCFGYIGTKKNILKKVKENYFFVLIIVIFGIILLYLNIATQFNRVDFTYVIPGLVSLLKNPSFNFILKCEFVFYIFILTLLVFKLKPSLDELIITLSLLSSIFIPALGSEGFNIGARFALLCPYICLLGFSLILKKYDVKVEKKWFITVICIALILIPFRLYWSYPNKNQQHYKKYDELIYSMKQVVVPEMLIAYKNFHLYYKFKTGNESFSFEPESHWDKSRIWRLVVEVNRSQFFYYLSNEELSQSSIYSLGNKHTLIREDLYQLFKSKVKKENNKDLYLLLQDHAKNPAQKRPAFLLAKYKVEDDDPFSAIKKN